MIRSVVYSASKVKETDRIPKEGLKGNIWVQVSEPTKEEMEELEKRFNLHRLITEDCLNPVERPKIEYFDDYIFVVIKELHCKGLKVLTNQIAIIIGDKFIITVSKEKSPHIASVENLLKIEERIRNRPPDFLMHAVIDSVVDDYMIALDKIDDLISEIEDLALEKPKTEVFRKLNDIKRMLILMKKNILPMRDVLLKITHIVTKFVTERSVKYFRDVYDHITIVIDILETNRDLVSGARDLYLSSISNSLNEVMKKLTVVTVLIMPLALIAGIYGMNFRYMPELSWEWGYPIALLFMFSVAVSTLMYLQKKGWT